MAWSTPLTAVANAALTAAQWNASVRDNLAETAPAKATTAGGWYIGTGANSIAERIPASATVGTSESSSNTAYVGLATTGPEVTVTTGTKALFIVSAQASNATASAGCFMSPAVSGATTVASTDASAFLYTSSATTIAHQGSRAVMQTLTPGSNKFTSGYRVTAGTGTWGQRTLQVLPF